MPFAHPTLKLIGNFIAGKQALRSQPEVLPRRQLAQVAAAISQFALDVRGFAFPSTGGFPRLP